MTKDQITQDGLNSLDERDAELLALAAKINPVVVDLVKAAFRSATLRAELSIHLAISACVERHK